MNKGLEDGGGIWCGRVKDTGGGEVGTGDAAPGHVLDRGTGNAFWWQ